MAFTETLGTLIAGNPLTGAQTRRAFDAILAGEWTAVQVGAFATALRVRGEAAETIAAGAEALRGTMARVDHGLPMVLDTCGTGGDGAHTLNLSTAAAIVVAACGVPVAKHGNRSISSKCGSADVLEVLGIPMDLLPAAHARILCEANITFLFAPAHHPALRHAAQARRELGVRTIFNALGPLANPAHATHQLVGVYEDALRPIAAQALVALGIQRAWVVRSTDGLDEVSHVAPTRVSEVSHGEVRERTVTPEDFGFQPGVREAIAGGTARENAEAIVRILGGEAHPARDAVILNAAAALAVADETASTRQCAERARAALTGGQARERLAIWQRAVALQQAEEKSA